MGIFNRIAWLVGMLLIPLAVLFGTFNTEQCGIVFNSEQRELIESLSEQTKSRLKSVTSVSNQQLCSIPTNSLKKALHKLSNPRPDHPGEAVAFRYQQQLSENKELNIKNWNAAREQVKTMRKRLQKGAGINSSVWESLGPGNIGGRIRSLAFDPDDSTRIYAGAVAGGVWLTEDSGASWAPTDDFMANLSVTTLIFDPTDSQVIYAGTGEGTFNADYVRGLGIFKSEDKGVSWSPLAATQNDFDFYWVNRLTILNDASRLLAATHTGVWTSEDSGVSWSRAYSGRSNDVNVHPTDNLKAIAGIWGGALYSEDGGQTWLDATGLDSIGSGRVEIAYARSQPDTVFASIDSGSGEIYKSVDGGQSFTLINTGESYLGEQGWYDNALWIDPTNPDHLIVGGIDLWRSTDGGVTLNKISIWWQSPSSAHADHHFVIEHPNYDGVTNKQVYFANDGGVYTAVDVEVAQDSVGWEALNNQLAITQFYGMGVSPNGTVVAGTQDNGTLIYKGDSENWTETFGGDGGYSAADPTDSNYLYGEYVHLQIHRSTNGGTFSNYIYDSAMEADGPNFIAPFILDPNNENRLLGGADNLWVSDDAKAGTPTWNSRKSPIASSSAISAIAVAKGNSDLIYVGHNDGSFYKTIDGTTDNPVWTEIDSVDLPQRYLMRIAIDPLDTEIIYASFGGYNENNLWKSTDGGANWVSASGVDSNNLPPAPVRTIAIHPSVTNQLYAGTEVGIFTSEDSGVTWNITNDGPANVSVDELVWIGDETLYAATHGRGVFRADLNQTTPNTIIFDSEIDVAFSIELTTAEKTITGIGVPVDVTITNGEYSLGCTSTFTSEAGIANNDDTICLRHTSGSDFYTEVLSQVTIGSSTFNFLSRTLPDNTPDDFVFDSITDTALDTFQTSNAIVVAGISNQVNISVSNGEYSIGCDSNFVSNSGVIQLSDSVCVRHSSSTGNLVSTSSTLTIGDVSSNFETTTLPDTTPDGFTFTAVDDVAINTSQQSETITLAGFQVAIPISVANGEYSIGCTDGEFTSIAGDVSPNETICVRHTSSDEYVSQNTTILDVNGVSAEFLSTTMPDRTPDDFSFASLTGVEVSATQTSETISVLGIAVEVTISISGGEYSIGCTDTFTSTAGTMVDGDTVCVRHTSSAAFSTQSQTTVNIGTASNDFVSTTKADPNPPSESSGGGSLAWISVCALLLLVGRRKRL